MFDSVKEIMNTNIEVISGESTVFEAIERLIDKRIRSLLVKLKKDYGIITVRDIIFKVIAKKLDPLKVKVSEIASAPVIVVRESTSVEEVLSTMEKFNIARVFVKDEKTNEVIGVVSFFDILSYFIVKSAKS